MSDWLKNPIVVAFALLGLPLFLVLTITGMPLAEATKLLVTPDIYDFSRGVGKTVDGYASAMLLGIQVILVPMLFVIPVLRSTAIRYVSWGLSVALVVIYFAIMLVCYVATGIH